MEFVEELESTFGRPIKMINIGGGLATDYGNGPEPKGFEYGTYREELQRAVPQLFSGKYQICTEMGTSLIQKAGKTLTR